MIGHPNCPRTVRKKHDRVYDKTHWVTMFLEKHDRVSKPPEM